MTSVTTIKNLLVMSIANLFLSCSAQDSIEKHNQFLNLNKTDLANLDSLNAILFRNKDKINADFEKLLKGNDSVRYKKSYRDFENSASTLNNARIELFTTDLNVTDSIVTYQIYMTVYKQVKIFHSLTFNAKPIKNKRDRETTVVKTKQLNTYWQYNIIND